jgi:hypothetical protein
MPYAMQDDPPNTIPIWLNCLLMVATFGLLAAMVLVVLVGAVLFAVLIWPPLWWTERQERRAAEHV